MNHQHVPEPPVNAWKPPTYTVDRAGKVVGARPRRVNNWGRWGAEDQRGTANLVTEDSVRRAADTVHSGRRFPLGLPIGGPPTGAVPGAALLRTATTGDGILARSSAHPSYADEVLVMGVQSYTQLDGLAHVADRDTLYNGYWAGLVTAAGGAKRLGVHHLIDGVVGRGVLLDVARHLDVPVVPPQTMIGPALLDEVLAATGATVGPGDVVLVRTGVLGSWDGRHGSLGLSPQAGLDATCVPWLAKRDVVLVGADNSAVEALAASAGGWRIPLHLAALRDIGLLLAELLVLDELAEDCAAAGTWDFMFVALPLPLVGAAGSPINPLAIR